MTRARAGLAAGCAVLVLGMAGCSGGSNGSTGPSKPDAKQILQQAKQTIDSTSAAHFQLTGQNVTSSGQAAITSGDGDIARPDKFQGTLTVQGGALSGKVNVRSVGGTFWVQLPIINTWTKVNPQQYGFGDPGKLLQPQGGISSLLTSAKNPTYQGQTRAAGDVTDKIHATLPGQQVGQVLTTADPSAGFDTTFYITPDKHQVRQVVITGPFFAKGSQSTYTVTLTKYGENVSISAPK